MDKADTKGEAPAGAGRPPTPIEAADIAKLASYLNQEQIADFYGMTDRGLRKRFASDEELRVAYHEGRAKAIAKVAQSLLRQATSGKNITAMIFYLKTQAGWKEPRLDDDGGAGVQSPASIAADVRSAVREMLKVDGISAAA